MANAGSEKSKKGIKILIYGVFSQIVTLLLGIIIPKLLIVNYGSEMNGLLSSIKQVFVYVALLEAGIGTAALQAMYEPIANDDKKHASEIMAATSYYYKRTGIYYGIAVIVLAIGYPIVIHSEIPPVQVAAIILLQGASGVIKYYFQGKLTILLRVDGRSYITTNITTIANVAIHAVQIALILMGFDVVAIQVAYFVINLLQMIYLTYYVNKHYKWLDLKAKPDFKALAQSKYVIIHQISGLIFNNTDMLILTYFCGLKVVSVYALYAMIFGCVSSLIDTLCGSVEFILGQAFNSDRKKFLRLQETYETYYLAVSFAMFTITMVMVPGFIKIYTKGVHDISYTDQWLPLLFGILNLLMYARRTSSQIINFAGHFGQTQWRSIIESVINVTVSIVGVKFYGIYGVLFGTIAALLYRTNDIIIYANCKILERKPWKTYRRWAVNIGIAVLCMILCQKLLPSVDSYLAWAGNAIWISVLCMGIFVVIDSLTDLSCCKEAAGMLKEILRSRRER